MSIPIPAGMEQAPVTWTLGHTTGTEALRGARGLVRFEPTAVAVAYPDVTVLPAAVTARVSAGVMDPVDLTVNDPELWNWRVTPELGPAWPAFHIDVPVEGVDLATAVVVPGIGPIRAVTGPPGTTEWADLTGKPATYPSTIPEVGGLQAIIDRLTYDTGWRDVSSLLPAGLAKSTSLGRCNIKWAGGRIYFDMNLNVTETGLTSVMTLPAEYRPDVPIIMPFTYWTATTANNGLPTDLANGYMGAGGAEIRVYPLPSPGTVTIYLDLPALHKTPPTTLPGDPA